MRFLASKDTLIVSKQSDNRSRRIQLIMKDTIDPPSICSVATVAIGYTDGLAETTPAATARLTRGSKGVDDDARPWTSD